MPKSGANVLNLEPGIQGSNRNRQKFEQMKHLNAGELGDAPEWLTDEAKAVWNMYVQHYSDLQLLCELDAPALTSLAVTITKLMAIDRQLNEETDIDEINKIMNVKKKLMGDFSTLGNLLGSSPKQRAQLLATLNESNIMLESSSDPLLDALKL